MSYYLITGGEKWTQVASIQGWREFREWAAGLDAADHKELFHLIEHGWSQSLGELESQLTDAIEKGEPSADIADIGKTILQALKDRGQDAESAILTDGLTENDDPDDSGWSGGEDETDSNDVGQPKENDNG